MRRRTILFVLACLAVQLTTAQSRDDMFSLYNQNWRPANPKNASYMIRKQQLDDTSFIHTVYKVSGPRLRQLSFKDAAGKILHGGCTYYQSNGYIDSAGTYTNGLPDGSWYFYNSQGQLTKRKDYNAGTSVKDTSYAMDPIEANKARTLLPGEIESSFKGGAAGWRAFMTANFEYPVSAQKANVQGTVVLRFIIDEQGRPLSPEIFRSAEFSLDEEALRLIRQSPPWQPASKDGKALKSYKLQPVVFRLQ